MSLLRHTLEEERHERIPTAEDPYGVPTGYVPRTFGPHRLPCGEPTDGFVRVVGPVTPPPSPCAVAIRQAVDDYLLMERKARALDKLRQLIQDAGPVIPVTIEGLDALIRHAPDR